MDGANTNALEWALALLHTPAERYTLRQKPLPQGIDRLLGAGFGVVKALLICTTAFMALTLVYDVIDGEGDGVPDMLYDDDL